MQSLNKIERKLLESDASTHLQLHTFGGMYNSRTCDIQTTYSNKKISNVIVWSLFVLILASKHVKSGQLNAIRIIGLAKRHLDRGPILGAGLCDCPSNKTFFQSCRDLVIWF